MVVMTAVLVTQATDQWFLRKLNAQLHKRVQLLTRARERDRRVFDNDINACLRIVISLDEHAGSVLGNQLASVRVHNLLSKLDFEGHK